jgi:hypothetical protein
MGIPKEKGGKSDIPKEEAYMAMFSLFGSLVISDTR